MSADVLKHCNECGEEYPLLFFRRNRKCRVSGASATRPKCIACEQDANDQKKRRDRWPDKARSTIIRHAEKYEMTPEQFTDKYGWTVRRIAHVMKHASDNTCVYCEEPYDTMGHGPADVTMDIIDPRKEPYLGTNAQPCCNTCNTRKGNKTPEEWAVILRCWRRHDRRKRLLQDDPMMRFPLWQAAIPASINRR
jgi:hypothetical protein